MRSRFMPQAAACIDSFLDGAKTRAVAIWEDRNLYLRTPNGRFELSFVDPFGVDHDEHAGEDRIVAPLPGTVVAVLAEEGATLEKGAPVAHPRSDEDGADPARAVCRRA